MQPCRDTWGQNPMATDIHSDQAWRLLFWIVEFSLVHFSILIRFKGPELKTSKYISTPKNLLLE